MVDMNHQQEAPFTRRMITSVFRKWSSVRELGFHPLAKLKIVEQQHKAEGYPNNSSGYGAALKVIVKKAINALIPEAGPPNFKDKKWFEYIIVTEYYIKRQNREILRDKLGDSGLPTRTFSNYCERAIDAILNVLREMELENNRSPKTEIFQESTIPFLAPRRPFHSLVGRDQLLSKLKRQLVSGENISSITLQGIPGVGKSALAVELAHDAEILNYFQDGVLWIGLGPTPDNLALLGIWCTALGMYSDEIIKLKTIEVRAKAIQARIGFRRMLIVVDDAWKIEDAMTFMLGGPNCAHIITTRSSEVALQISSTVSKVEELNETQGLQLIKQLALEGVGKDTEVARLLVKAVGALPLALVLIGNFLRIEYHGQQPRRIQQAFEKLYQLHELLQSSESQSPAQPQPGILKGTSASLNTVIAVSDEALERSTRETFYALSIFPPKPNTFSEEAALAISAGTQEDLDLLCDCGLLESSSPGRYTLHRTIVNYAKQYISDEITQKRIVSYYLKFIEKHQEDITILDREKENIDRALKIVREQSEISGAYIKLTNSLFPYWEARGLFDQAEEHLQRAKQLAERNEDLDLATVLGNLGHIEFYRGKFLEAEAILLQALKIAQKVNDLRLISGLKQVLGKNSDYQGRYVEAETLYRESLILARETGDLNIVSTCLLDLGAQAVDRGMYEEAKDYLIEGLEAVQWINNPGVLGMIYNNLGVLAGNVGDFVQEEKYYQKALKIAREMNHQLDMCYRLGNLGALYNLQGNYSKARSYLEEALIIANKIGNPERLCVTMRSMGEVELDLENYEQAEFLFQKAWLIADEINHPRSKIALLLDLGSLMHHLNRFLEAEDHLQKCLNLARKIDSPWHVGDSLNKMGELLLSQRMVSKAKDCFTQALNLVQEIGLKELIADALFGLSRIDFSEGNISAAYNKAKISYEIFNSLGHKNAKKVKKWLDELGVM